jgi:hypothetical protein
VWQIPHRDCWKQSHCVPKNSFRKPFRPQAGQQGRLFQPGRRLPGWIRDKFPKSRLRLNPRMSGVQDSLFYLQSSIWHGRMSRGERSEDRPLLLPPDIFSSGPIVPTPTDSP